ncbi:3,4-dihydroxy-2-butanone-4-phosphate synthase [Mycolicibacterium goodii]|uniref:Riboflavin kinase domain-containing protein n=1 Tax=Mycolicibacterium goodii TaxID=134601 RepID=A0A0K0X461_MYCGD|nr:hypothetical protein AFA91_09770 [Mycolicibacterium goodii]
MESPTRVEQALSDLAAGRPIVLIGSAVGDPDGYLLLAAEKASPANMAFLIRHSSGFVCAAVTRKECERLDLSPMGGTIASPAGGYYTVAVDASDGIGTGISASDRARTLQQLATPSTTAMQLTRPGHVVPRRAHDFGVLAHQGPAEVISDLTRAAGLHHVGAFAALVSPDDPTRICNATECVAFAAEHQLNWVSADDVALYRRMNELHLRTTFVDTRCGRFGDVRASGFRSKVSGLDYIAYCIGSPDTADKPLLYVHQEYDFAPHPSTADAVLPKQFSRIAEYGDGVVIVERRTNDIDELTRPRAERRHAALNRVSDLAQIIRVLGVTTPRLLDVPSRLHADLKRHGVHTTVMSGEASSFGLAHETVTPDRYFRGIVAHGDQRGRELGFATANLELDNGSRISALADGVWAGRCILPDGRTIPAAVSIGRRSTFYGHIGPRLLEAHLLDFNENLYEAEITVHLDHWIRGQETFASKEDLIAALQDDVRRTRLLTTGGSHSTESSR